MRLSDRTVSLGFAVVLLLGAGTLHPAGADAPVTVTMQPIRIVVLMPAVVSAGIDAEQLRRSVSIYLRDLPHEVLRIDEGATSSAPPTALATIGEVDLVVWFSSSEEQTPSLRVFVLDRRVNAATPLSFVVARKNGADPSFYRVVSLKLRSELRACLLARSRGPAPPEVGGAVPAGVKDRPAREDAGPRFRRWLLELRATGAIPTDRSSGLFFAALGVHLRFGSRWSLGLLGSYATPSSVSTSVGTASNTGGRVAVVVRARLAGRPLGRGFALWAELDAGMIIAHTSAHLDGSAETRTATLVLPLIGAGFPFGYRFGDRIALVLSPRVEVFPLKQDFTVRGTVVYSSGWVLPALDLALQISL